MNDTLQNTDKAITPTAEQMTAYMALDNNGEIENVIDFKITVNEVYIEMVDLTIAIHKSGLVTKHYFNRTV